MAGQDDFIKVQNQIRENSMQIRDYIDELNKWQEEIKEKDATIVKSVPQVTYPEPVPQKIPEAASPPKDTKKYKRDFNNTAEYYKAWDQFDADKALEELDNHTTYSSQPAPKVEVRKEAADVKGAKAFSKVSIKGGRRIEPIIEDPSQLKNLGNTHFSKKEFDKAIELYTKALKSEDIPKDLKVTLHSNRAQAYINVKRYKEAETECSMALELDHTHAKSWHRRGVARYYLKDLREAKKDLEKALSLAPGQTDIKGEIENLKKEMDKVKNEQLLKMIEKGKIGRKERVTVKVEDINEDEVLKALEEKRKELERELQSKPKKGVEEFLSDDEENELNQLS